MGLFRIQEEGEEITSGNWRGKDESSRRSLFGFRRRSRRRRECRSCRDHTQSSPAGPIDSALAVERARVDLRRRVEEVGVGGRRRPEDVGVRSSREGLGATAR